MDEKIQQARTKVFISHANREDNFFAFWLASRLSSYGYDVWCDVRQFGGGEYMWNEITKTLENETIVFIFVLSEHSVKKQGTLNELAKAGAVQSKNSEELVDFIIPIRLDHFDYRDSRPELINIFTIDFYNRWAQGLNELVDKFETAKIPKIKSSDRLKWFRDLFSQYFDNPTSNDDEQLDSNWFSLKEIPDITIASVNEAFLDSRLDEYPYPVVRQGEFVFSFSKPKLISEFFQTNDIETVASDKFLSWYDGPEYKGEKISKSATSRLFVGLLNQAWSINMEDMLKSYDLSNTKCYYLDLDILPNKTVKTKVNQRPINLVNKIKGYYWHFAISAVGKSYPIKGFAIKHHVLFSNDGKEITTSRMTSRRRNLAASWYNYRWRNCLLSFMQSMSDNDMISLKVGESVNLSLSAVPETFEVDFGIDESKIKRIIKQNEPAIEPGD